jgi:hypothetical protein
MLSIIRLEDTLSNDSDKDAKFEKVNKAINYELFRSISVINDVSFFLIRFIGQREV